MRSLRGKHRLALFVHSCLKDQTDQGDGGVHCYPKVGLANIPLKTLRIHLKYPKNDSDFKDVPEPVKHKLDNQKCIIRVIT